VHQKLADRGLTIMISAHFTEFVALALALTGLAVVAWEIALKDPRLFREIATDVRAMAEPRRDLRVQRFVSASTSFGAHANNNEMKKAA